MSRKAIADALRQLAAAVELPDDPAPANDVAPDATPETLSARDLGVSPRTLRAAHERGELTLLRIGREYRVCRDEARRWLSTLAMPTPEQKRFPGAAEAPETDDDIAATWAREGRILGVPFRRRKSETG